MWSSFQELKLFGGSIVCDAPASFVDFSDQVPIPDNREAWVDSGDTDCLIGFELASPSEPSEPLSAFYWQQTAKVNDAEIVEVDSKPLLPEAIPNFVGVGSAVPLGPGASAVSSASITIGTQRIHKREDEKGVANLVLVLTAVIRVAPPADVDIVVNISAATVIDPRSVSASVPVTVESQTSLMNRMLSTLKVLDWSMFLA